MARSLELIIRGCCSGLKGSFLDGASHLSKGYTLKLFYKREPHHPGIFLLVYGQVIVLVSG